VREVAPCLICGGRVEELEDFRNGTHYYTSVSFLEDETLCEICIADWTLIGDEFGITKHLCKGCIPGTREFSHALWPEGSCRRVDKKQLHSSFEEVCPKCNIRKRAVEIFEALAKRKGVSLALSPDCVKTRHHS
jgi:hypothetical protein